MPIAPPRPCSNPGCPNLQPCAQHPKTWRVKPERGTTAERGYGARHRRWAALVLAQHPLCPGIPPADHAPFAVASTVADHVVPLPRPNWWDGDWSLANGQGLCRSCHARKSRAEGAGQVSGASGP